jgi:MFS family permease
VSVSSNIPKLYVTRALRWFLLIVPVIVPFFKSNGLTMTQIMVLQSAFSIAVVLLEVPSGYFADVLGRKRSIILGSILGFFGMTWYSLAAGFWQFLVAEIVLGVGSSFISGADTALLYDTLVETGRAGQYKKIEGVNSALGNFSEATASVIGGLLASISIRLPFFIEAGVLLVGVVIALTLVEPHASAAAGGRRASWRDILGVVAYAMHGHREVRWLILFSSFVGASTLTMVWFVQPLFGASGLPLQWYGVAWAVLNASVGLFSLYAYRVERVIGEGVSRLLMVALVAVGYLVFSRWQMLAALPVLFVFYFARAMNGPLLSDAINRRIPSDIRATVLSVNALVGRLIFSAVGPSVGWVSDHAGLGNALLTSGLFYLAAGSISLVMLTATLKRRA